MRDGVVMGGCGGVTCVSVWSVVFYCIPNVGGKCFGDSKSKLLNGDD